MINENDNIFIACRESGQIIGCCVLTRLSAQTLKLRQMAVDIHWQRKSIGAKIIAFAEQYTMEHGYSTISLHARKTASEFYTKCGYTAIGEEFTEVGIPHILMNKQIQTNTSACA